MRAKMLISQSLQLVLVLVLEDTNLYFRVPIFNWRKIQYQLPVVCCCHLRGSLKFLSFVIMFAPCSYIANDLSRGGREFFV